MSTAVGAAVDYLAKQRTRNDEAIRQANEAIYEDLVIELQKRVEDHSERLNEQGEKIRDLSDKQQRAVLNDYIHASHKTSSPAKQRAYTVLAARFWMPEENVDVLPFWWNQLVDLDPAVWAAMLQLRGRLILIGTTVRSAAITREFDARRNSLAPILQELVKTDPEAARKRARELIDGMVFAVDRELDRFAAVLFAHQVPLEIAAENRPRFIRSAKLPGERLFWLARDGDYLVELASE